MDFVEWVMSLRWQRSVCVLACALGLQITLCTQGCSDWMPVPSIGQLEEFAHAGPTGPAVDTSRLIKARLQTGPHRVVPGEVLELNMPAILRVVTAEEAGQYDRTGMAPFVCRVSPMGTIVLPVVGEMPVAGRSLAEIESGIAHAYYPTYAKTYPSVFAKVLEYQTHKVSITGAVQKPGIYDLRADQMSLVTLIMEAGGIIDDGAGLIRITRGLSDAGTLDPSQRTRQSRSGAGLDPDLRLSFRPLRPSSTIGTLLVARQQQMLANTDLDLASDVQRHRVLNQVSAADPGVSTDYLDQQLVSLGAMIGPAGGEGDHAAALASAIVADGSAPGTGPRPTASVAEGLAGAAMQAPQPLRTYDYDGLGGQGAAEGEDQTLVLPVRGMNIPFADVALRDGDNAVVERMQMPIFTVIGLVNRPGNFPYPPDVQYSLMQALAFAGGRDEDNDPRYAIVYRLRPDGSIVHLPFEISRLNKKGDLAMGVLIKPGDIIAVEHTLRTRTRALLSRIFNVHIGAYIPLVR